MNREQIYVAFRKRLKVTIIILLLEDMELLKKHWLTLDWLQRSIEEHLPVCMKTI